MSDVEQRLRRLEDIEAIRALKARYCAYCDDNYNPDGLASLFTEDAVWDGGRLGRFEGREAIREFFAGASKMISFALHNVMNPLVEVEGDTATGRWYLLQPCTLSEGNRAVWLSAHYSDRYRRVGGEWKFEAVDIDLKFLTPYEEGWAKTPFLDLGD